MVLTLTRIRRTGRAIAVLGVVAAGAAGQAAAAPAAAPSVLTHVVARGETMSAVALRLGVSVAGLAEANGIADVHRIRVGQRLVVPGRADGPRPAAVDLGRLPDRLRELPERLALLPVFDAAARTHKVPADLLKALTWLESGWQNDKVSSTRAVGIGQLMPATVAFVNEILLRAELDPTRPEDNITLSARFLAYLLTRTEGDVPTALAAYYQGLASVRRDGIAPSSRRYAADILALRRKF